MRIDTSDIELIFGMPAAWFLVGLYPPAATNKKDKSFCIFKLLLASAGPAPETRESLSDESVA